MTALRRTLPVLVLALGWVPALSVWAQRPDDGGDEEPAVLQADTAPALPDSVAYELTPLEIVGSIAPWAAGEVGSGIPASISVRSGAAIDAWAPRLLSDALSSEAGISVYDDLGSPYKANLSTRGFHAGPTVGLPSGVSVFLDGVPQNEPGAQEVNFDLLPLDHVRRIEILRGNASLLGPNSLGGAINLITRRGEGPSESDVELAGGSFGRVSGRGSLRAELGRGWELYGGGGYEEESGWREATGARRYQGLLNVDRTSTERGLRFQALWSDARAETAGSLPESIYRTRPRINFTAGDFEAGALVQGTVSGFASLFGGSGSARVYLRSSESERFNVNQPPDDDVRGLYENGSAGLLADWRREVAVDRARLSLRLGSDLALHQVRVRIFEEERGGGLRTLTTDVESPGREVAAYATGDLRVDRLTVSAGARFDHVRIPFEDVLDPSADTVSTFARVSPRGGVGLEIGAGVRAYGSVARTFRAPAILELACSDPEDACPLPFALGDDPPLDPVRATTWEAGFRWRGAPGEISLAAYRTGVSDEIFFVPSEQSIVEGFFRNFGDTRREGLELSFRTERPGWSAWANYAFTRATFRTREQIFSARAEDEFEGAPLAGANGVEPGDRLPLVPAHQASFGGAYRLPGEVELGLDARYVGEQWLRGDEANETRPLDAYFVADFRVARSWAGWRLEAIVRNALDTTGAVFGTFNVNQGTGALERFLTPLEARSWTIRVRRALWGA